MKAEVFSYKESKSVEILPIFNIVYKDKGLSIYLCWIWWGVEIELKPAKHDVMGNLRKPRTMKNEEIRQIGK